MISENIFDLDYRTTKPMVVLMPTYNHITFLKESIESILVQDYNDFDFLILDDGSTDNTWKVLQQYANLDKRIKLFRHRSNRGIPKSLNDLLILYYQNQKLN